MRLLASALLIFLFSCSTTTTQLQTTTMTPTMKNDDKYLWLEEIENPKAIEFAKKENAITFKKLESDPRFETLKKEISNIVLANDRIPWVYQLNGMLYNFWKDEKNPKGLWRRTTLASYKKASPDWEIVLDLDKIAKEENENWVWKGATCFKPKNEKCLLELSRGGKDAVVLREFNLKTKSFVKDGFDIPEAKSNVSWIDDDTIYLASDFGPGTMTESGYARQVKILKRGQRAADVKTVFEVGTDDMSASGYVDYRGGKYYHFFNRTISFFENEDWFVKDGHQYKIPMPKDAKFHTVFKDYLIYELRTSFQHFKEGTLLALPLKNVLSSPDKPVGLEVLFEPTATMFLDGVSRTKNTLLLNVIDNVKGKILKITHTPDSKTKWHKKFLSIGHGGVLSIDSTEEDSDNFIALYTDFITPYSSFYGRLKNDGDKFEVLKESPSRFNSSSLVSEQKFATSKDGTKIPYFIVHSKEMKFDGSNPTLLTGYGGFEVSIQPYYLNAIGKVWSEKGGVYVVANLRGGGEFGPKWHRGAMKENHQNAIDDFIAVAEDLIKNKVTSPKYLGIKGGSNGGLLVGASFVQRPELFNAVICEVPLLDMLRYHKLLAGASWMDEYGNPDIEAERAYISKYSPFQNVSAEKKYPEVFFITNTKDDRVHPGHARKMVAKMKDQGHPILYFENTEGGHGGSASLEQVIFRNALEFTYLWKKLGK